MLPGFYGFCILFIVQLFNVLCNIFVCKVCILQSALSFKNCYIKVSIVCTFPSNRSYTWINLNNETRNFTYLLYFSRIYKVKNSHCNGNWQIGITIWFRHVCKVIKLTMSHNLYNNKASIAILCRTPFLPIFITK